MNMQIIDTMLDYLRLVAYAVVILTSLRGIMLKKFTNLLFVGDIFLSLVLIFAVVFIHLFEIVPSTTLVDDEVLTTGAVGWALIHFVAMVRDRSGGKGKNAS